MSDIPFSAKFSFIAAVLSLVLAIRIPRRQVGKPAGWRAYVLVGAWALIPPLWFIVEWHFFDVKKGEFEHFKYSQELARNVWVAFVIVLAKITGITWPGKE